MKIKSKIIITFCFIVCGSIYFNNRFLPFTYINGINVTNKTPSYIKSEIDGFYNSKKINITSKFATDELDSRDISYAEKADLTEISKLKEKQNNFLWFIPYKKNLSLNTNVSFDENKLDAQLTYMDNISGNNIQKPVDAKAVYINKKVEIKPEINGNLVDKIKLKDEIIKALRENRDINLDTGLFYVKPRYTKNSKKVINDAKYLTSIKNKIITIKVAGTTEKISGKAIISWYTNGLEKSTITYVDELKNKYDNYGDGIKDYKTINGLIVTIPDGGNYGWRIDKRKTVELIVKELKNIKTNNTVIEPVYHNTSLNKAPNIGNTFIEVDLNKQLVYGVKNGVKIFELPAVTGKNNKENETRRGVFKIWSREKNRYLTGEDYKSYVNFWMPFTFDGQGFHDASWQSSFGGNAFLSRGSRGCVNLSYDSAKTIYDTFSTNTPVIIY